MGFLLLLHDVRGASTRAVQRGASRTGQDTLQRLAESNGRTDAGDVLLVPRIGYLQNDADGRPSLADHAPLHHGRPRVPDDQQRALRRRTAHRLSHVSRDPGNTDRDWHTGRRDLPTEAVL